MLRNHTWNPPFLAPADSLSSGGCPPPWALSSGSAVAEKFGREDAGWVPSIKVGLQILTLIKVGPLKVSLTEGPRAPTCSHIKSGDNSWSPPIPAPADSPHLKGFLPPTALFSGSAVVEKGGREDAGWVPSIKVGLQAVNFN